MSSITQAGVTPRELDSLVDGERWRAWCRARPELAAFDSLATIRRMRGTAEDQALGALLWLAATDGGDDQLAAIAVLHQLGGSVRVIARNFWHAAEGEAEGVVAGAMWEQIRAYNWRQRTGRHAAAIHHATRKSVRSVLLRDDSRWQSRGVIPLDPQSWFFEAALDEPGRAEAGLTSLGSQDELQVLLLWSLREGVLNRGRGRAARNAGRRGPDQPANHEVDARCLLGLGGRTGGFGAWRLRQVRDPGP